MSTLQKMENKQIALFALLWLGGAFAGMDANLINVVLPDILTQFEKEGSSSGNYFASFTISSFLFGWMVGGMVIGYIADKIGRVKACSISIAFYTLFTGFCAFAADPLTLIGCRFLSGLGVGGEMVAISILIGEHFKEKGRALATGALITSYQVGVFLSGAIVSLAGGWKEAFLWGGAPFLLVLINFWKLEESPDWKSSKEKQEMPPNFWKNCPKQKLILGAVIFGSFLIGYWASLSWIPTWIYNLPESHVVAYVKEIATMTHGAFAVLGCSLAGFAVNVFGRIRIISITLLFGTIISLGMFFTHQTFSYLIFAEYGLLGGCIGLLQGSLYIYLAELFPTEIRGRGVGICLNAGRAVTALAVLFIGAVISFFGSYEKALSIFSLAYLIGFFAVLFAPETGQLKQSISS